MTSTVSNLQIVDPTRAAILKKIKDKQSIINGCQEDIHTLEQALNLFPDPVTWATTTTTFSGATGTGAGIMNYSTQ